MQQINWAVMGCGHIAKTFITSINEVKCASVVACASSNLQRAKDFAAKHNIAESFGDYQSMLEQRSINAVYIATTHNFHFEQIIMCLKSGKHVLCEKPLTLNAKQAKVAFDLAKEHNLLLVEAVWTRFLPAIQALKQSLASGVIGEVQCVQANFSLNRDLPNTHRLLNKDLAGGALLDLGIYPITIADIVFEQRPVSIISHKIDTATGVDKNSFYTLAYKSGAIAQLSAGFRMSGQTYATIMGDKGVISVPFFLGAKSYSVTIEGQSPVWHEFPFDDGANFKFEIEHFTQTLLNTEQKDILVCKLMPASSSLRVLEIMDSIRQQWGLSYANESC